MPKTSVFHAIIGAFHSIARKISDIVSAAPDALKEYANSRKASKELRDEFHEVIADGYINGAKILKAKLEKRIGELDYVPPAFAVAAVVALRVVCAVIVALSFAGMAQVLCYTPKEIGAPDWNPPVWLLRFSAGVVFVVAYARIIRHLCEGEYDPHYTPKCTCAVIDQLRIRRLTKLLRIGKDTRIEKLPLPELEALLQNLLAKIEQDIKNNKAKPVTTVSIISAVWFVVWRVAVATIIGGIVAYMSAVAITLSFPSTAAAATAQFVQMPVSFVLMFVQIFGIACHWYDDTHPNQWAMTAIDRFRLWQDERCAKRIKRAIDTKATAPRRRYGITH